MAIITNPILRGFNPDPSILRVGDDYYIATSTFEWFPGVQIHHSRDLVHWRLLTRPLTRPSQLDMLGNTCSGGIWAPCLSYDNGAFYLVYTNVRNWRGVYHDLYNYVVTAPDIMGPWSEPVYLNSVGFDPSLFHDDDGTKWLLQIVWDHRQGRNHFHGIRLQQYDHERQVLVGDPRIIFRGTELGGVEGPHLYERDGWYYLLTAEGGTGYQHAVTMARSRRIEGPYEIDPANPILTSGGHPELALQKAGHGSLVQTQTGEWYLAHLVGRPLPGTQRCILGRETAIQRCTWTDDGWLRLADGGHTPSVQVPGPDLPPAPFPPEPACDEFESPALGVHYQTLRIPATEDWLSLAERPGYLRLRGQESPKSMHRQSLVARRIQSTRFEADTCLEFRPRTFQQMAGLICWYDISLHWYLRVTHDEDLGACLGIVEMDDDVYSEPLDRDISVEGWDRVHLRAVMHDADLRFFYSRSGGDWREIGPVFDASKLSDEYGRRGGFTGAFVGLCAHDLSGARQPADFDYFRYQEND